ncbi:nucleotidyltransferase domain-containing protein [Pseudomarimonas arenosa]|uniref:Nucleotidyltransferase domain-containing protein n=1 Tax=Pseudomarimonas arenosa TaxID=2774145 RepID=A0AAW3ZTC1_9GAMM|nr:nucleotidyltransferase domain-containing protein [Pseudomarimonas arenosa]MBD8527421.1 nucleotidyltransferase domain-containing protein [Pseudomarimonas arenosa]
MSVDESVRAAIETSIAEIEHNKQVRVLFAAESGSRAWGCASPDSDYDVRFIYVHELEWYLRVSEPRDVIEARLPGDLDLSGWELRKTLRLFAKCNLALNEWLGSPIVYRSDDAFVERLRQLIPTFFRPPHAVLHYLRTAQSMWRDHLDQPSVRLKKVFYALRPLLACRWIEHTLSQPPTEFEKLLQAEWVSDSERQMIGELQAAKVQASEADRCPMPAELSAWLVEQMGYFEGVGPKLAVQASGEGRELDRVLAEWVVGLMGLAGAGRWERP